MAGNQPGGFPGAPMAPPTAPGFAPQFEKKSSWPAIIGILAIVLGGLAALGALGTALMSLVMPSLLSHLPQGQQGGMEVLEQWKGWMLANTVLSAALGTLLLVAGIGLARRRAWARSTCLTWAVLKMLFVVAGVVVGFLAKQQTLEIIGRQPNMPAMPAGLVAGLAVFGGCIGLVWGWALPVFLLIWLSRGKIRAEMAGWGGRGEGTGAGFM